MKLSKHFFAAASAALLALGGACSHRASAQDAATAGTFQRGWLEGTVLNEQGQPIQDIVVTEVPHVKGARRGGGTFDAASDSRMGGLYSVQNLQPGVYDLTIAKSQITVIGQGTIFYRPQRIFGVIVKPGVRTILPITLEEGTALEDIGQPAVTEQALLVSQELARLQKQIDDLKSQIKALDQLRAQVQTLTAKVSAPPAAGTSAQ